ncbi:MAG: nucleoside-diphosphate sugar epimerase/dehydratase [Candidatus Izemoplasmatales bacterium]|nr:nucleoside-diphosphate sugar epimerase/dehydratase [Candidatus Izemoplasmatales bacterium]
MKRGKGLSIGEHIKSIRIFQFMFVDAVGIAITYLLAILVLKFSGVTGFDVKTALIILPIVIVFKIVAFYFMNLYKIILDNVGLDEVIQIFLAVLATNAVVAIVFLIIPNLEFIPELHFIYTTVFEALILSFPRLLKRFLNVMFLKKYKIGGKRTLLVGAGAGGKLVLNEVRSNPQLLNVPVAFVDDDPLKIGKLMSGYKIYGPIEEIPKLIDSLAIEEVIIAIANIDSARFQEIIRIIAQKPVKIKRLPKFKDLKKDVPKSLLEVNVEDLLSRDVIELDDEGIRQFITGKRILVTGAGGSIGSELVRQIVEFEPAELLLLDIYENNVYDLQMELKYNMSLPESRKVPYRVIIGSVYNYERMESVFSSFKPQLIFHAAAYKHVPLMEDSAVEAVRTNIIGTYNLCKLADKYNVAKMILVSSDKAVRPTNVMGATKRFAEMIMQHFASVSETKYCAVRFGNVLGSNGSVVPLFKKQIEHGGPVTVTDRNIIRYFMTIPEAVGLILQAATFADGGEIFILDMGEPVRIIDLAEKMIMLAGYRPYIDIDIQITGLRPGEKLFEELLLDGDGNNIKTANKKIFIDSLKGDKELEAEIKLISDTFEKLENQEIKELVQQFVPTYQPKQ